jgi:hypothetical protein
MERYQASVNVAPAEAAVTAQLVMKRAGLPRLGTSGAANAYLVLIGSEFGTQSTKTRPQYALATMGHRGWTDLWKLRVGRPNPHFDPRWESLRANARLWKRLFDWLPGALGGVDIGHSMFAWANLSVTEGGKELGTSASHSVGMREHVVPFIEASCARVVVATNERTRIELDRWAALRRATHVRVADINAWLVNIEGRRVLAAKVGHASQGVSKMQFVQRVRALVAKAEDLAR